MHLSELIDDVLECIVSHLPVLDLVNAERVAAFLARHAKPLLDARQIHRLVWSYASPPYLLRFTVANVVEIDSLEPSYHYRSFACRRKQQKSLCMRDVCGVQVVHVHRTWIDAPHARFYVERSFFCL